MPLTEAPAIARSEPLPVRPRAGVSLRFVVGLTASLVLHGCLFGLLRMQAGPFGAPVAAPASALLIEWHEADTPTPTPAPPRPALSRLSETTATTMKKAREPATAMAVPTEVAEEPVETATAAAMAVEPEPATAAAASSAPPDAAAAYLWDVLAHLRHFQHYPEWARRDGIEGTIWLRARVSRRGDVLRTEIERSSGHIRLDAAAARLVARASPLPPPPASAFAITDLRLPVEYRLSRE